MEDEIVKKLSKKIKDELESELLIPAPDLKSSKDQGELKEKGQTTARGDENDMIIEEQSN